jgi:hypothetical protein
MPKVASVSGRLLDFWFVTLMAPVIRPKSVTLTFDHLAGEDGFMWRLSGAFE